MSNNTQYQAPKGTYDIYGEDAALWRKVEEEIRKVCDDFRIAEIRTPLFEYAELFQRSVGETTDIVQKEMFTFTDRGERVYALKPEGTAGVARAYIEHGMASNTKPVKLYYITSAYRAERPQKGRYVELRQFGVEHIGSDCPAADVEVISVAHEVLRRLGVENTVLHINSIGCPDCRARYNKALKDFIGDNLERLCPLCRERSEKNPLRTLDCKNESCRGILENAPSVLDSLDEECTNHFGGVLKHLDALGIQYVVDPHLVRGLDYYTRTVFEFISPDLGSQSTVCAGGRYDNLIEECGGQPTGATGFGLGLDRLLIILKEKYNLTAPENNADIFIGSMGEDGAVLANKLVYELRQKNVSAEFDTLNRSVKAQMKFADKIGARFSLVIGDSELENNTAQIKNMQTGESANVLLDKIYEYITSEEL